jgi:FkbM family methyltransferase
VQSAIGVLHLAGYAGPFRYRRVSSDRYVFNEVFLSDQYACVARLPGVCTIVDLGANIGATSVYLLHAYAGARVIAVEPDAGNFAMLEQNLAPYGGRATAVRKAAWHRAEPLVIHRGGFRDGAEWSFQVASADPAVSDVEGITLEQLMHDYGVDSVDLLKIDIEGAERWVLSAGIGGCLNRVRTLAIELHDDECRAAYAAAIDGHRGRTTRHGELTVWRHDCFDEHRSDRGRSA